MALALGAVASATFSDAFERCFGRVHVYVSRHTDDRESLERIVSEVLVSNLDLFIDGSDEAREICLLKRSADRWIAIGIQPNVRGAPQKVSAA